MVKHVAENYWDIYDPPWRELLKIAVSHAEKILREALRLRKEGVTALDFSKKMKSRWEKELYAEVLKIFKCSLLGKDTGYLKGADAEKVLVLDLFDGSSNFLFDCKYYSYNLAVIDKNDLVFGLCIDLENFDVFHALKNNGAYLNEKKLHGPAPFIDRIICSNVVIKGTYFLHFGCSSLELCMLARGSVDIVIGKSGLQDIAAAMLIALESGAVIKDWNFSDLKLLSIKKTRLEYVAGHRESVEKLSQVFGGSLKDKASYMPSSWSNIVKRGKISIDI
ncbi:MAG: hypothetical protein DRJ52_04980 [Thermoprotei archaeon]|nr:MAG: hypothetical protein DRJ52_04980 [Thermoprotei archaeon]RLE99134.1 MAG: hypothetical protein DRJ63_06275 [Thermoprotei archaeon]